MPPPARILFIDHTAALSGGELALLNLVRHLDRTRFEPVVLLFSGGPLVERLSLAGVETHILPLSPGVARTRKESLGPKSLLGPGKVLASVAFVARVRRFIARNRFDLVHTNSLKADLLGGLAARLARKPLVWHVHDRIEPDYLPKSVVAVFRLLARILPHVVVANSWATLATLRLPARKLSHVIPPGIDPTPFAVAETTTQNRDHGGHPLVAIVGRISPWKGQHVFLRAAALVHAKFPDARFQIIGSAMFGEQEYERSLHALVTDLGLNGLVEFTGFVEDVPALLRRLDLLVHASTSPEPFGQVLVEAMAAAKPVVATGGGGVAEIVENEITGLLVPMDDPYATAQAITRLFEMPSTAHEMGLRGRQRVLDHYTIRRTARDFHALYHSLLNHSTGRSA